MTQEPRAHREKKLVYSFFALWILCWSVVVCLAVMSCLMAVLEEECVKTLKYWNVYDFDQIHKESTCIFFLFPLVFSFYFNYRCSGEYICMLSLLFLFEKKKLQNLSTAKKTVCNLTSAKLPIRTFHNKIYKVNTGQISYAVTAIFI